MDDYKGESPLTSEYVLGLLKNKRSAPASVVRQFVGMIQRGDKLKSGAPVSTLPSVVVADDDKEGSDEPEPDRNRRSFFRRG